MDVYAFIRGVGVAGHARVGIGARIGGEGGRGGLLATRKAGFSPRGAIKESGRREGGLRRAGEGQLRRE